MKTISREEADKFRDLYMYMLRNGILGLEDREDRHTFLPYIRYAIEAFIDGVPGPICTKIYWALEDHFREFTYDVKTYQQLAQYFFETSLKHFDRTYPIEEATPSYEETLARIEQEVEVFLQMLLD